MFTEVLQQLRSPFIDGHACGNPGGGNDGQELVPAQSTNVLNSNLELMETVVRWGLLLSRTYDDQLELGTKNGAPGKLTAPSGSPQIPR